MRDVRVVRGRQAVGDLGGQIEQPLDRNRASGKFVAQRSAVDELGRDVRPPLIHARFVHGDDVRMVQGAGGAGFGNEPLHALRMTFDLFVQNLQRHVALEARVARAIHVSAAPLAEQLLDFVGADRRAAGHGGK